MGNDENKTELEDEREAVLELIKKEMTSAWAYLQAYAELFEHSDEKRVLLLEETAPGFFALVQTSFIESALTRLSRLMDPETTWKKANLSFMRLHSLCSGEPDFKSIQDQIDIVYQEWDNGKYQSLKKHRNQVQGHNDFPTIKNAPPLVTTKITLSDLQLIKELFRDLWGMLETAHHLIKQISLIEPTYGPKGLNQLPTAIFRYLSAGLYMMEKTLASRPDMFADFVDFEFAEVGRDGITKLIT